MKKPLLVDPSSRGGIPSYTQLVARAIAAAGETADVLGSRALERPPGDLSYIRLLPDDRWAPQGQSIAARLRRWWRTARQVDRTVRERRPGVVHFQAPINRRFDVHLLRRLRRTAPVVWTAHNVLPFEESEGDRARFAAIYRQVDRVIVHTQPAADAVRALAGVEAVVVDHPVAADVTRIPQADARKLLGLPQNERVLCAVGFIRSYKGYGLLADTWERLGDEAPLLLVMGELFADTEQPVIDRLSRHPRCEVRLGYAGDEQLHTAICAADALLLPYAKASDSGVLHLARALGTPVLASDAPELAASVTSARAGLVVPRTADAWAAAVTGTLPPPPPPAPDLSRIGQAHLEVYRDAARRHAALRLTVYSDATEIAGAEQSLATLIEALPESVHVTVAGVDDEVVSWLAGHRPGASSAVLPAVRDKRSVGAIGAHLRYFMRERPQLLQVNLRHPFSCQYALAAGLLTPGTRVIAVEHRPDVPAANGLQLALKRLTSARLAAHVTVSESSKAVVAELLGTGGERIRTIHNGVAEPSGTSRPGSATSTVGVVGRFIGHKGFDVFLRALALVPEVRGVLIGDGPERGALERLAAELGLEGRVEFLGWRADSQTIVAERFDALVVPSRAEPFGLVAVEAMLAGVPVVASRVGGLTEIIDDGVTGILVAPDDPVELAHAIERVIEPAVNRELGERGKASAHDRFSQDRMARSYDELYRSLVR
jgi:glycosyltransferase involved in cell wall biosynthesis